MSLSLRRRFLSISPRTGHGGKQTPPVWRPARWFCVSLRPRATISPLDEPLLLWFLDGLRVVSADDGRVRRLAGRLAAALGLVGVVGAFVAEHVADEEHQGAQDGEDHHRDDTCRKNFVRLLQLFSWSTLLRQWQSVDACVTSDDCRVSVDSVGNHPLLV